MWERDTEVGGSKQTDRQIQRWDVEERKGEADRQTIRQRWE